MGEEDTGARRIVEALKSLKQCARCDNDGLLPEHRHCGSCGMKNPDFTSEAFFVAIGMGVDEFFNTHCKGGHKDVVGEILDGGEDGTTHKTFPFCLCCGERYVDVGSDTVQ